MEEENLTAASKAQSDETINDDVSQQQASASPPVSEHELQLDKIMHSAIASKAFPGGVVLCERLGTDGDKETKFEYARAFGTYTFDSNIPVSTESSFDVASLTKVLATATSILILLDQSKLALDDLVCSHLPEFAANGKGAITIKHLLTHSAGLKEWYNFKAMGLETKESIAAFVLGDAPVYPIGTDYKYSDLSMIVLGLVVEKVSNQSLSVFAEEKIFSPLGMKSTSFRCTDSTYNLESDMSIVPTEVDNLVRKRLLWGEVHDLNAYLMGGVAGHAGIFSNAVDLAKFCRAILRGGKIDGTGKTLYSERASELFLSRLSNTSPYGFGWNLYTNPNKTKAKAQAPNHSGPASPAKEVAAPPIKPYRSGGQFLSDSAVGHTGFTGTSLWLDPLNEFFVVLLTNSVHPHTTEENGEKIRQVRPAVADAAFQLAFGLEGGEVGQSPSSFSVKKNTFRHTTPMSNQLASISASSTRTFFSPDGNGRWKRHARDLGALLAICLWSRQ